MQNFASVKRPKPSQNLDEDIPDLLFFDVGFAALVTANFLENVPVVSVLHDEAETAGGLVNKSLLEADNVRVLDAGQYPHFIKGIFLFFIGETHDLDLFQGVEIGVVVALDLVDGAVGAVAQLLDNCEVAYFA